MQLGIDPITATTVASQVLPQINKIFGGGSDVNLARNFSNKVGVGKVFTEAEKNAIGAKYHETGGQAKWGFDIYEFTRRWYKGELPASRNGETVPSIIPGGASAPTANSMPDWLTALVALKTLDQQPSQQFPQYQPPPVYQPANYPPQYPAPSYTPQKPPLKITPTMLALGAGTLGLITIAVLTRGN